MSLFQISFIYTGLYQVIMVLGEKKDILQIPKAQADFADWSEEKKKNIHRFSILILRHLLHSGKEFGEI